MHRPATAMCTALVVLVIIPNLSTVEAKGTLYLVQHQGREYELIYLITGSGNGVVKSITAEDLAIRTTMQSEEDAHLILIVPKELLNATHIAYYTNESSTEIFEDARVPAIFVDGVETKHYTARLSQSVIMFKIPFEAGTEQIDIVGIDVPEFDGLVFVVMGMSIAGIVLATVKYRTGERHNKLRVEDPSTTVL